MLAVMGSETLFYLPNHFRQTIMVNSNLISFAQPTQAVLDMMNVMFRLESSRNSGSQKFTLGNFFAIYRSFFTKTMPYEALSFYLRVMLYKQIKATYETSPYSLLAGPITGMFTQLAMQPLFLSNLVN